jgi:hypothetical protein
LFTDRERKIITIMLTVINPLPEIRNKPDDVKQQLIIQALRIRGFEFNESEIIELVQGITKESQFTIKNIFGFLQKNGIDWKTLDFKNIMDGSK